MPAWAVEAFAKSERRIAQVVAESAVKSAQLVGMLDSKVTAMKRDISSLSRRVSRSDKHMDGLVLGQMLSDAHTRLSLLHHRGSNGAPWRGLAQMFTSAAVPNWTSSQLLTYMAPTCLTLAAISPVFITTPGTPIQIRNYEAHTIHGISAQRCMMLPMLEARRAGFEDLRVLFEWVHNQPLVVEALFELLAPGQTTLQAVLDSEAELSDSEEEAAANEAAAETAAANLRTEAQHLQRREELVQQAFDQMCHQRQALQAPGGALAAAARLARWQVFPAQLAANQQVAKQAAAAV